MLLHRRAVADADQDGFRKLGAHQLIEQELKALVERRGGLVEEHHLGSGQQDAGERDPLLFPGRQHLGPVQYLVEAVDEVRQRHLVQHALECVVVDRAFLAGVRDHSAQVTKRHVGQLRKEHRLVGPARPGQRARAERPQLRQAAQQRGFPLPDGPVITIVSPTYKAHVERLDELSSVGGADLDGRRAPLRRRRTGWSSLRGAPCRLRWLPPIRSDG